MFNGTSLVREHVTLPVPAQAWQDGVPDTADQALERRSITSHYPPGELNGQTPWGRPLSPNLTKAPRLGFEGGEPDRAVLVQAIDHSDAESGWESKKRTSPSDFSLYEGPTPHNIAQTPPLEMAELGLGTKRRKASGSQYRAEGLGGPSRAGPLGWSVSTSEGASAGGLLSRYNLLPHPISASYTKSLNDDSPSHKSPTPLAEPSCYINDTNGAYLSHEIAASSTHGDEAEVIGLISSNDSSPQSLRSTATPATNESTPPKLKLKLRFKQAQQVQLHQPRFACSLDSQGSPYPSPYSSTEPSNNILAYDAARAKKGTTLQPTAQVGKEDKYTSVLEHDLAITKTRLAKANDRLKRMDELERDKEVFRTENQDLKRRLAGMIKGQAAEGRAEAEGTNYCAIAPRLPSTLCPPISADLDGSRMSTSKEQVVTLVVEEARWQSDSCDSLLCLV